jgi:hypothetical protein
MVKRAFPQVWEETITHLVTPYKAPINDADCRRIVEYFSSHMSEDSMYDPWQQLVAEQC